MLCAKHPIWPIARFYDPDELGLTHMHVRGPFQCRIENGAKWYETVVDIELHREHFWHILLPP